MPLMTDKEIKQIICGKYHIFILKISGKLFAFGINQYDQLGLGDNKNGNKPTLLMTYDNIISVNEKIIKKTNCLYIYIFNCMFKRI